MKNTEDTAEMTESDLRRSITQKAMAYDLINLLRTDPQKTEFTPQEIEEIIHAYIRKESEEQ